jgi:predicted dehydrogenase
VLDWDAWLGPAPKKSYNDNRALYRFRWFYDYSGGQLTNMGSHYFDMIHWALGVDAPSSVVAMGGKYVVRDNREIPDTLEVMYQYPKTIVTFTQTNASAAGGTSQPGADVEFRGTKGTLYLLGKSYIVIPEANYGIPVPAQNPIDRTLTTKYRGTGKTIFQPKQVKGNADTVWHTKNFIASILSKKQPNCPIEVGHRSSTAAMLGNIALKQGIVLTWDPKTEQFTGPGSKEANAMLKYEYRAPYKFPTVPQ